jgi:hypothetical protein
VGPARIIAESLTPKPGIREHNLPKTDSCTATNREWIAAEKKTLWRKITNFDRFQNSASQRIDAQCHEPTSAGLFNHCRRVAEGPRHIETGDLGSLKIDDDLEFRWMLHGQIGRFGAAEYLIDYVPCRN